MKNRFKNFFKLKSGAEEPGPAAAWPINFIRDWKILVLIFAAGLIFLSIFSWRIYLSNRIGGGYLAPEEIIPDTFVRTVDIKRLNADLKLLEDRQADYLKAKAGGAKSVDPAL